MYSQTIRNALQTFFDANDIKAKFEEKEHEGVFTIGFRLQCKLQSVRMLVIVRDNNFSCLAALSLRADEDHRLAVAEFLTRVNYNMRIGNFELDMEDGEIRFKTYQGGENPDQLSIQKAVFIAPLMLDRFGDALLEVLFGFRSPKEAFDSIT